MSTVTANIALKLINPAIDSLEDSYQEFNWNFTELDRLYQELANTLQAPDAGTLGGQDLAFVLALANATGTLPVTKGGTGATTAEGIRASMGFDTAWDAKLAAALSVAPAALDTLLEIVAEVQNNDSAIAAINTVLASKAAQSAVDAVDTRLTTAEAGLAATTVGLTTAEGELNFLLNGGTTGALTLPAGTTAQRPTTPVLGDQRRNTTTGEIEVWSGTEWGSGGAGGGMWEPLGIIADFTTTPAEEVTYALSSDYHDFRFIIRELEGKISTGTAATLMMQLSANGGSTWGGASDYKYYPANPWPIGPFGGAGTAGNVYLFAAQGYADWPNEAEILIANASSTIINTHYECVYRQVPGASGGQYKGGVTGIVYNQAGNAIAAHNAVRLYSQIAGTNFEGGVIEAWGRKKQ